MTPAETFLPVGLFMLNYVLVALGGALGSILRYWCSGWIARHFGETFPLGTLAVNVTGSFVIGFFATLTATEGRWLVGPYGRNFFMTGICGGYTTFSSFSLQTLTLARDGEWFYASLNSALSLFLCLLGVWFGHFLAELVSPTKLS